MTERFIKHINKLLTVNVSECVLTTGLRSEDSLPYQIMCPLGRLESRGRLLWLAGRTNGELHAAAVKV